MGAARAATDIPTTYHIWKEISDFMADDDQKPIPYLPFVTAGAVVLVFSLIIIWIVFFPNGRVWTNDAYVTTHYTTVAPRISGQVQDVLIDDNQTVKRGQVLVQLDPRDYETALAQAQARLAQDKALVLDAEASVDRHPAIVIERQADVTRLKAQLQFVKADARRFKNLAATGAGSRAQGQATSAQLHQLLAQITGAEAAVKAEEAQTRILEARREAALRIVKQDEAQLRQAALNLSYTKIIAPFDGMVGEKTVQKGNYVGPGAALMALVPMDCLWVQANFREIALRNVAPGQKARIHVDAYNIDLDGVVDSVPPASGAAFAPIAPENATGNFTKIVQRLPVKIVISPDQPLANLLRMGFSVETTIFTGNADIVGRQAKTSEAITDK